MERSKYAYNSKNAIFYGNHVKCPNWLILNNLSDDRKKIIQDALSIDGIRHLPWPSTFYKEVIKYAIDREGLFKLRTERYPVELSENEAQEITSIVTRHYNDVAMPDPRIFCFTNGPIVIKKEEDVASIIDFVIYNQEDITLSAIFDSPRTDDSIWLTDLKKMNDIQAVIIRRVADNFLLVIENESDIVPVEGIDGQIYDQVINISEIPDDELGQYITSIAQKSAANWLS